MKKFILLIILILTGLLSFNIAYAEECDFNGLEIGDDISKAVEIYGEPKEAISDDEHPYIEISFNVICPGYGIEDGEVKIILLGDIIGGFLIQSFTEIKDDNIEEKLIHYYIKENYGNLTTKIESLDWTGGTYWKTFENKFYYDKKIIRNKSVIEEELLITNAEFGKYL